MTMKWLALGTLCIATITACAGPSELPQATRAIAPVQPMETRISDGACDGVGQRILTDHPAYMGLTLEASAVPTQR